MSITQIGPSAFDQDVRLSMTFGKKKMGALLVISGASALRLKELEIIFTPTIDKTDADSTRKGDAAFQSLGYQRPPDASRVKKIADYYSKEDFLGFTTPIIVAVRKDLDSSVLAALIKSALVDDEDAIKQLYHAFAVIDGQHRGDGAFAAISLDGNLPLDIVFVLIHGLSYEEETEEFNVINTTPKRLPKALVEWNRYGITQEGSVGYEQDLRLISVQLATDSSSPWFDQINLTGTGREPGRPVTLEGMRRSTDNMLKAGGMRHLPLERRYELVKRYWSAVAEVFSDAWEDVQPGIKMPDGSIVLAGDTWVSPDGERVKTPRREYRIKELVGVASLAKLGGDILTEALGNSDPFAYIDGEVQKLAEVDWEKTADNPWVASQAGFAGQKALYEALATLRATGAAPWD